MGPLIVMKKTTPHIGYHLRRQITPTKKSLPVKYQPEVKMVTILDRFNDIVIYIHRGYQNEPISFHVLNDKEVKILSSIKNIYVPSPLDYTCRLCIRTRVDSYWPSETIYRWRQF